MKHTNDRWSIAKSTSQCPTPKVRSDWWETHRETTYLSTFLKQRTAMEEEVEIFEEFHVSGLLCVCQQARGQRLCWLSACSSRSWRRAPLALLIHCCGDVGGCCEGKGQLNRGKWDSLRKGGLVGRSTTRVRADRTAGQWPHTSAPHQHEQSKWYKIFQQKNNKIIDVCWYTVGKGSAILDLLKQLEKCSQVNDGREKAWSYFSVSSFSVEVDERRRGLAVTRGVKGKGHRCGVQKSATSNVKGP